MTVLTKDQRALMLASVQYRASHFPRSEITAKLTAADKSYHLADVRSEDNQNNQSDSYSRFAELDNALGREVAEAYSSYYTETFLGKSKIFSMTSSKEQSDAANSFNVILSDQDRQTKWKANLVRFFLDCAKYNLAAIEVSWVTRTQYAPAYRLIEAGAAEVTAKASQWRGNAIKALDLYNTIFDTRVSPDALSEEGEFAGYIELYSQVRLFQLVQQLKLDPGYTVYDAAPADNPEWNIYTASNSTGQLASNLDYRTPEVTPLGSSAVIKEEGTNWVKHFGGIVGDMGKDIAKDYTVAKFYMRIVPASYGLSGDSVQIWELYILDSNILLASKLMDNAHSKLPIILGQPDADALGYNTAGPTQIAIPYKKTVKQLLDRVLAGADRVIRGKAIYDTRYLDENVVSSAVPDAKIPTKAPLPSTKSLSDVYHQIDMQGDTTGLGQLAGDIHASGMRAGGINNSQSGQFTKGNRTLEEYNDVQNSAVSKQYIRALILEGTAIANLKSILKLNILQYQESTTLYDPDAQATFEISRQDLYKADVEFVIADTLLPTEYMLSPNVQQQLLATVQTMPQAFAKYDIAGMIVHILEQSAGVNLKQYELTPEQQAQTPPPAPPA